MPGAHLIGHLTSAARIGLSGRVRSFMVHFAATGSYSLIGLNIRELADQWIDLGALSNPELQEWARMLVDAPDDRSRADGSDEVLLRRLMDAQRRKHSERCLATATAACRLIAETQRKDRRAGQELAGESSIDGRMSIGPG